MIQLDTIHNCDCLEGMRTLPDGCVDLCVMDPPYQFKATTGGGAFGSLKDDGKGRAYHAELFPMSQGFAIDVLDEVCRLCRIPNLYVFCNKDLLPQLLDYAVKRRLNFDLLTWHKTNPTPTCSNKYLSDTEYIVFMRGKGARVYGTYETKRKYWLQPTNTDDKKRYGHPTIKPLNIIRQLIVNSSQWGGGSFRSFHGQRHDGRRSPAGRQALRRLRAEQGVLRRGKEAHQRRAVAGEHCMRQNINKPKRKQHE